MATNTAIDKAEKTPIKREQKAKRDKKPNNSSWNGADNTEHTINDSNGNALYPATWY